MMRHQQFVACVFVLTIAIACQDTTFPVPPGSNVLAEQPASPPPPPATPPQSSCTYPSRPTGPSVRPALSIGQFLQIGDMVRARNGHTATLLADGRVLLTGGDGLGGAGRTAELYDPATRTFTPTGSMLEPRGNHTATLLANGQVLIAGPNTSSAELYDPATGKFVSTGSMLTVQYVQSATLLPGGSVLVAGDVDAELFDPATGTFRQARSYAKNVYVYAATLLKDGRVLFDGDEVAQLYDPTRDSFTLTGCMGLDGLEQQTSTLLENGKVLVAGGGNDEIGRSDIAELYDPATGTFARTDDLRSARSAHAAVLLSDGKVLIVGGDGVTCSGSVCQYAGSLASAELYDPATETFAPAGSMHFPRTALRATLLNDGDVLITGGLNYCGIACYGASPESAELYHPAVSAHMIAQRARAH